MDAEQVERLRAALAGRYTLEWELGRGGMATVWLARDLKNNRHVALKVLHPELAAALGPERFLREITVTAQLDHPHILALLDSGRVGGHVDGRTEEFLYYTMPYVEGESLRDRLNREKQLSLDDSLQIAREVADALGYAHAHQVIHRDIKPENILLAAGHARVADFGIARAVTAAGGEKLTETGLAVGTPAYMSPEQAAGQRELDSRSDIYALGCVLYEMLAGQPPFTGPTAESIVRQHLAAPVPSVRVVRGTVPESVDQAVARGLAKVPADRFKTPQDFANALGSKAVSQIPAQRTARRRGPFIGLGVLLLGIATVLGLLWSASRPRATSPETNPLVVVLPFENLGSPEDAWFADGITEEITSRLAQISGLGVISRTSAIQYRGTQKATRQIGAELGVQYLITGSIRSDRLSGGIRQARVSPQLIRVSDDTHLWADRYNVTMERGEIFSVQADIAEHVAQALDVRLLESERRILRAQLTQNAEAYDAYLRGNQYAHGGGWIPTDTKAAIAMYRRAIQLDPRFAEAHARLSLEYVNLALWGNAGADTMLSPIKHHAQRALALNPDSPWGHVALANYYSYLGEWALERSEAALADKLAANSAEILHATSGLHWEVGERDQTSRNLERASKLDPLSADIALSLGVHLFSVRRHAKAESLFNRVIVLAPDRPETYMYKAWLYLSWHGDLSEARAVLQSAVQKLGPERAFVAGFLRSEWWASRILASDPWYRTTLMGVTLGAPDLDSAQYYMHKAGLLQGLGRDHAARLYWDSVVPIIEGRIGTLPSESRGWGRSELHKNLALALVGLGRKELALREARRADELDNPTGWPGALAMALTLAAAGEHAAATAQFKRVMSMDNWVTPKFLSLDPALKPLRQTPEYQRLLAHH